MMGASQLLLLLLGGGYLTHAVVESRGPLHLFDGLRTIPLLGDLFACQTCWSFWSMLLVAGLLTQQVLIVEAFALAGTYLILRNIYGFMTEALTDRMYTQAMPTQIESAKLLSDFHQDVTYGEAYLMNVSPQYRYATYAIEAALPKQVQPQVNGNADAK